MTSEMPCGCRKDEVGGKPACDFFQGDGEFCGECEHPEKCHKESE